MKMVFRRGAVMMKARKVFRSVIVLPRRLLRHSRGLEIALFALAMVFSFYLAIRLLYLVPRDDLDQPVVGPSLKTDVLDKLEFWIEDRQWLLESGLVLPDRPLFDQ